MNPDNIQWVIVAFAVGGMIFNTGVLWNDIRHLKKSVDAIWNKINTIDKYLLKRK